MTKIVEGIRNGDTYFQQGYKAPNPDLLAEYARQQNEEDSKNLMKIIKKQVKIIKIIRTFGKSY